MKEVIICTGCSVISASSETGVIPRLKISRNCDIMFLARRLHFQKNDFGNLSITCTLKNTSMGGTSELLLCFNEIHIASRLQIYFPKFLVTIDHIYVLKQQ